MFDIHAHGGGGVPFDDILNNPYAFDIVLKSHFDTGTDKMLIALLTCPINDLYKKIELAADYCESHPQTAKGIYLEGPFLSPLKKGAHDPKLLLDPTQDIIEKLVEKARGHLKMITIAPELKNGLQAIEYFESNNIVAAIGHTNADYNLTIEAINAGAHHFTHLFNAMNGINHREPGPIIAALEAYNLNGDITVEIVADGFHLHEEIVKWTFDNFHENTILVTDSMEAANMPDGDYKIGELPVIVKDGKAVLKGTDTIAGSTLNLQKAYNNCINWGIDKNLVENACNPIIFN